MTDPSDSIILHFIARIFMVPFILIFGFYVFTIGEAAPGGGFQGGAIMVAAVALIHMSVGREWAHRRFNIGMLSGAAYGGVAIFVITGAVGPLTGQPFLDYEALWLFGAEDSDLRKWGAFIVEAGIGITVFGVLALTFDYLTQPQNAPEQETGPEGMTDG
jgi:multicomponent Na+:H+ antiporter subunit B